jgi:hypothetical protein
VHTRSALVVGVLATNVPVRQSRQAPQSGAFDSVLKVPTLQSVQARSLTALPIDATRVPTPHTLRGTHAVAGSASSSQVSSASLQAIAGASPPGQCWPATQSSHTGGAVVVPGWVCTVPAAQSFAPRHMDWFSPLVNVPAGQAVHSRSLLTVPAPLT